MEFRSVTNLEELEALPDDAKILVIDAGTAKQISKANAKFGGGVAKTVFYFTCAGTEDAISQITGLYKDAEHTTEVTARELYDAFQSGTVEFYTTYNELLIAFPCFYASWVDADFGQSDIANLERVVFYMLNPNGTVESLTYPAAGK